MTLPRGAEQGESGEKQPRIKRGRVDSFAIYEITEQELEVLENGSPDSIQLNFSLTLLSASLSFLITLITTVTTNTVFTIFTIITVVGFFFGVYLLLIWLRSRVPVSKTIKVIRARIPEDSIKDIGEQSG